MSKKAPSPRRTHIKEAHTVMQEALLHVGDSPAAAGGKNAQVAAHKRVASAVFLKLLVGTGEFSST